MAQLSLLEIRVKPVYALTNNLATCLLLRVYKEALASVLFKHFSHGYRVIYFNGKNTAVLYWADAVLGKHIFFLFLKLMFSWLGGPLIWISSNTQW